jgi:hypothetical protein
MHSSNLCSSQRPASLPPRVLRAAYELRLRTPPELQPTTRDWEPLPPTGDYTGFRGYPPAATELFAQVWGAWKGPSRLE